MRKTTKAVSEGATRKKKDGAAGEGSVMTTMRFPRPLKKALTTLAANDNRKFSNYVITVLSNHAREAGELPSEG